MQIKNSIVIIDEINARLAAGDAPPRRPRSQHHGRDIWGKRRSVASLWCIAVKVAMIS